MDEPAPQACINCFTLAQRIAELESQLQGYRLKDSRGAWVSAERVDGVLEAVRGLLGEIVNEVRSKSCD